MTTDVLPGAEAYAAEGGAHGALVLHGFTGNPGSMRGVAEALARAGFAVELPRLPGHGTTVEDMVTTTWADWTAEVEAAHQRLATRTDRIVVVGLSMGGTLAAWTAVQHPDVAGLVFINPLVEADPDMVTAVRQMIDAGETRIDGIGSDIADPDAVESAYVDTPLAPLQSMLEAVAELQDGLATITAPVLVMHSAQDHVVPPANAEHLASTVSGPVERVTLERSYHVATLDYDQELIHERVVDFARRVTA